MSLRHAIIRASVPLAYRQPAYSHSRRSFAWGFFGRNSVPAPIAGLLQAAEKNKISEIHERCKILTADSSSISLTNAQLAKVVYALVAAGRDSDLELVGQIMANSHNIDLSNLVYSVAEECVKADSDPRAIFRWINRLCEQRNAPHNPKIWSILHNHCIAMGDPRMTLASFNAFKLMRKCGFIPSPNWYKAIIQSLIQQSLRPDVQILEPILQEMKQYNIGDNSVKQLMVDGFMARKLRQMAQMAEARCVDLFSASDHLENISKTTSVYMAIRYFQTKNIVPSLAAMHSILSHGKSSEQILATETALGLSATSEHWALVIGNVAPIDLKVSLQILEASKVAGIPTSPDMLIPIIRALVSYSITRPSQERIGSALALYYTLPRKHENDKDFAAFAEIYELLFYAFLASGYKKYVSVAKELVPEMKSRNVTTVNSKVTASIIVLFMRNSSTAQEAYNFYQDFHEPLDAEGYHIVLNAFRRLFCHSDQPAITTYFDIVKEMQRAGFNMLPGLYIDLLRQLGEMASADDADLEHLSAVVDQIHNHVKLDVSIPQHTQLRTQLMDTYVRVLRFSDASDLWDTMYLNRTFDQVSVSVILDACARNRNLRRAVDITTKLFRDKYVFDSGNWVSWLECLCKAEHLNDAVRMVCTEMGKNGHIPPALEHLQVLLKFAGAQQDDVLKRVELHQPILYVSYTRKNST